MFLDCVIISQNLISPSFNAPLNLRNIIVCEFRDTARKTATPTLSHDLTLCHMTGREACNFSPTPATLIKKLTRHKGQTVRDMSPAEIVEYSPEFGVGVKIVGIKVGFLVKKRLESIDF